MTVTATETGSTASGILLFVRVVTGQAASPVGQVAFSLSAMAQSITPMASGSLVYGAFSDNQTSLAANGAQTTLSATKLDPTNVWGGATIRSAATTTGGTPVTLGLAGSPSAPALALVEVLSGTGLTEDASSPVAASTLVAATIATAAFTPPAGSLVVAMAACEVGFSGSTGITISNTGGLAFTAAEVPGGGGSNYLAGVWTALVPGGVIAPGVRPQPGGATWRRYRRRTQTLVPSPPPSFSGAGAAGAGGSLASAGSKAASGSSSVSAGAGSGASTALVLPSVAAAGGSLASAGSKAASGSSSATAGAGTVAGSAPPPLPQGTSWEAARAGLPGDASATSYAVQVNQFLDTHGITPVYAGTQLITSAGSPGLEVVALGSFDIDQPFTMPAGKTAVGRVTLPLLPAGNAADTTVSLCTNAGGNPGTVLASARLPGNWVAQLAAPGGLDAAGPLATAVSNTMAVGSGITAPWNQAAVSLNGSGNFATAATGGDFTIFLGGFDSTADAAVATVSTISYLGGQAVSGPLPQPSLPQAAFFAMAAVTADTVIFAGGGTGLAVLKNVWTASWDPSTGTVGAWTAQAGLPQAAINGGMAIWQDTTTVYVCGGNSADSNATATAVTYWASAANGQITAWTPGPPLPQAISGPYVAAVGGWLIVAGGVTASGTALSTVYYAQIGADGAPGDWITGPALPAPAYAFGPAWNLAVTDSAMIITSGTTTGNTLSPVSQALTVTADGPARAWQVQAAYSPGVYQVAVYPDGNPGEWQLVQFHLATFDAVTLNALPLVSVPLPATGLTAGGTYHVVVHQDGGDRNDYVLAAVIGSALPASAQTRPAGGGSWTPLPGTLSSLPLGVWDQAAAGQVLHTWEDAGARITALVLGGSASQFLGLCEATAFEDGTLLAPVSQVTYDPTGTIPVGVVQLA